MELRTREHAAGILILMFTHFGQSRMRISKKTFKAISRRKNLKQAFVDDVWELLTEFDIELIEINRGYCLVKRSALDGAKTFTLKAFKNVTDINLKNRDDIWQELSDSFEFDELDCE
jgi:hypothetical protein